MGYNNDHGTYSCDFCGVEMQWAETDDIHGELWGCERCGRVFCSKCFKARHGEAVYREMMNAAHGSEIILCPDCMTQEAVNQEVWP